MMMAKRRPAMLVADLVEDERELLHRGDDDLLALCDELAQVAGVLGVADRRADLRELLDRVANLLVRVLAAHVRCPAEHVVGDADR